MNLIITNDNGKKIKVKIIFDYVIKILSKFLRSSFALNESDGSPTDYTSIKLFFKLLNFFFGKEIIYLLYILKV